MSADINSTTDKIREAKDAPSQDASTKLLDAAKTDAPKDPVAQAVYFSKVNAKLQEAGILPGFELTGLDAKGNFLVLTYKTGKTDAETSAQFGDVLKSKPLTMDPQAVNVSANQLHDAIFAQDNNKIQHILEPLNQADRKALENSYQVLYSQDGKTETLRDDLQTKLQPGDYQRSIAILNRNRCDNQ